jgi:hypothetical protein
MRSLPLPVPPPELRVFAIRGQAVMLDSDLAALYGVPTKVFNQTIRRNAARFPGDFLFQLTPEEFSGLKPQMVTSKAAREPGLRSHNVTLETAGRGQHRKYLPLAFTEHGAIMAATILRSARAVTMSVYVVRAFVRMRQELLGSATLAARLKKIDRTLLVHDTALRDVYAKIRPLLLAPPIAPKRKIGFHQGNR